MKRTAVIIYLIIYIIVPAFAQIAGNIPKYEARAVWLTTIGGIDWPHCYAQNRNTIENQKQELISILNKLQSAGINQVLLQARIRATTIYPSKYEPWDGCLSGVPGRAPGYDALKFAIDECHKRGMELHAWIVSIPVGKWNGVGCRQLRKRNPNLLKKIEDEGYINPENPKAGIYLADICEEIARHYDVDGIHLDYIRYPETWKIKVSADRGRKYITDIVRHVHNRIKPIKPYIKLSCAPIGKHDDLTRYRSFGWNAYSRVCQDAQGWLREGLMDQLFPMMYFQGKHFYPFIIDWSENAFGRIITPGLGIYCLSANEKNWSLETISREMEVARQYKLGYALFRSKFFTDNTKNIYTFVQNHNSQLALVPPMTWECRECPKTPYNLGITGTNSLSWQHDDNNGDIYYNVYSSRDYPVDTDDGRNLVAIRLKGKNLKIPLSSGRYYAVTATNRFGIESRPAQQAIQPQKNNANTTAQLLCDGKNVILPILDKKLNPEHVLMICDLKGKTIVSSLYISDKIDISRLNEGTYQMYYITSKGTRRRLGFFTISRGRYTVPQKPHVY